MEREREIDRQTDRQAEKQKKGGGGEERTDNFILPVLM